MKPAEQLVRVVGAGLVVVCTLLACTSALRAQGITTGGITGLVTDAEGKPVSGAQVQILNKATGYSTGTLTRPTGLYLVQGLQVGGPYTVSITSIGYEAKRHEGVYVSLSQNTRVDVQMATQAVQIAALEVTGQRAADFAPTHQGVSSLVSDSMLRRLPAAARDFSDLAKLTPQVVKPADGSGASAGGQYNRFNSFTIDGANMGDHFALNASGGQPGAANNGKMISIEAVKEFRVVLSPTDVRQGNFAGMQVNAVTKNGTNDFHGGGTYTYRNQDLAPSPINKTKNTISQYGFSVGGPIIKNKLHFFVAPELQSKSQPASGFYLGQPADATPAVPISSDSLQRIVSIMKSQYNFDVGTPGSVNIDNPLRNLFGRIDYQISPAHRLVLREVYNHAENGSFSRNLTAFRTSPSTQDAGFRLGSNMFTSVNTNTSTVAQLFSNFANGRSNEFMAGYNHISDVRNIPVTSPEVTVAVTPTNGTSATSAVTFGTEEFSPNNILRQDLFEATDNLSLPFGSHTVTVGGRVESSHIYNNFAQRLFGVYKFANIADLAAGKPIGYSIGYDNSGTGNGIPADFHIQQYSLYAQDSWAVNDRLTVTYGVRTDIPRFLDRPLENPVIATTFANIQLPDGTTITPHTSDIPKTQILWSPRIGFNFDPTSDQKNQIRGSVGVYTGPPPFILVGNAYANTGLGLVTLTCSSAATAPTFTMDVSNLPHACAGQPAPAANAAGTAGVNHTDPNFKYPQSFSASLGFDRQLPYGAVLTIEGLYRHDINGVFIRDLNLKHPRFVDPTCTANCAFYTDRNGRVLYADTISATGAVTNAKQKVVTSLKGVNFTEGLIDVTNQSKNHNYSISAQLRKRFSDAIDASVAYTYMRSWDVQSLTSDRAISNWRNGRQTAGSHDEIVATTSYFERPHRLIAYGTYTLPWKLTDVSAFFEGISGTPITYTANGDLNGDGEATNDPIYVPRNATDPNEIRMGTVTSGVFTADPAMAADFDKFISSQPCLDKQRGKIMARNSCRSPFQKRMDVSVRQSIPQVSGQNLALQLDIFNFLNLLNKNWGQISLPTISGSFPQQQVLLQNGRTPGPLNQSMSTFSFDSNARKFGPWTKSTTAFSNYYQMQLTLRWAF